MAETNQLPKPPIFLYTDGASSGNPGPGGYGVVLKCAGRMMEMSEGFCLTTNNRMELLAVIKGLEAIAECRGSCDQRFVLCRQRDKQGMAGELEEERFCEGKESRPVDEACAAS